MGLKESFWDRSTKAKAINVGILTPEVVNETDPYKQYQKKMANKKPCMVPAHVLEKVGLFLTSEKKLTARGLQKVRDIIQKWYFSHGYVCAQASLSSRLLSLPFPYIVFAL